MTQANQLDGSKPLKNAKHERFALLVSSGEVAAAEAYRREVSDRGTAQTQHENASKLSAKVTPRIEHLREKLAEKAAKRFDMSKEQWLARLKGVVDGAEGKEDFSAATGALDKIGKACAYYEPEQHSLKVEVIIGGNADG